jgi:HEAT repeat protein
MIRTLLPRTLFRSFVLAVATTLVAAAAATATIAQPIQPGDQSRWSLDFLARMEQSPAHPIEIHMTGTWTTTISAVRESEYDAQLQVADLQFAGDAVKGAPPASLATMQGRLSRPFWATYRSDGGLVSMHFYRDMTPSDRNLLQMIATELQLVRPTDAPGSEPKTWTAQERDGAGEYSALYVSPQPDRILKRKLKYLYKDGVAGAPANALRISIEASDIAFTIAPDSRVEAIDGKDGVRMSLSSDKSGQLEAVTEFHASHLQTRLAPELIGSLKRALPEVVDSSIVTQRPDASTAHAEADERLLEGYTTEAVLDAAFAKDPSIAASPDRLTALFRRRPEAAGKAAQLLIKNGPRKSLTNALGAAGSPSSVAALSGLAHNTSLDQDLRVDAILAFVQMQHPTAAAMHVPVDLVTDSNPAIQSAARLICGALAHAGRPNFPSEADANDAVLLALYRDANDTGKRVELLSALGNSAGQAAIQTIEESLTDSSVLVRAAAARALRLAPGPDIDRILAGIIVKDSDPAVRADAIFATRFRRPLSKELADALEQAASTEQVTYVRSDALAVLSQNLNASPQISEILAKIARSDADAGIRQQATKALAALSNTASPHP